MSELTISGKGQLAGILEIAENSRKPPSRQEVAGSIPAAGFS
jgi:hypothetical protein